MEKEVREKIEEIIAGMNCPKDFKCAQHGFERLCKAGEYRIEGYLECLEKDPPQCPFAFSFGYSYMCQCPLRVYTAKKLNKLPRDEEKEQADGGSRLNSFARCNI